MNENYDLTTITRDNLLSLLSTGKQEIIKFTRKNDEIKRKEKEIEELENKIKKEKKMSGNIFQVCVGQGCLTELFGLFLLLGSYIGGFVGIFMIILLILYLFLSLCNINPHITDTETVVLFIIISLIALAFLILICTLKKRKRRNNYNELVKTITNSIQQNQSELSDLKQQQENIINDFKAIPFIPNKYCYEDALIKMVEFMQDKRADNWKECTKLYEDSVIWDGMIEFAKVRAEQAAIQTELARQTRIAARWAAGGAWASAAGIWRINSKI